MNEIFLIATSYRSEFYYVFWLINFKYYFIIFKRKFRIFFNIKNASAAAFKYFDYFIIHVLFGYNRGLLTL